MPTTLLLGVHAISMKKPRCWVSSRYFACWRRLALAAGFLLWAGRAAAGNDDQLPVGGEASIYGGAVIATVSDGAAGYHNPAGLAQSQRNQRLDHRGRLSLLPRVALHRPAANRRVSR